MDLVFKKSKTDSTSAEFIIIISMMMALTALSIDAMLPALPKISSDLGATNPNDRQLIISLIFFGQAVGQLFFGPLSDKTGRKPAIYAGYALFIVGSLISVFSINFSAMLIGRALQGIGISAPRAVSMALVRDKLEGRRMAQVMSFASTIFILVPMIAPTIGQGILSIAGWRGIFGSFILFALVTVVWFALRVPETLALEKRLPFSPKQIVDSTIKVVNIRTTLGYTLVLGLVQGVFLGYLNSSQQIFQEQYGLGTLFPLYFAVISLSLGVASLANTRLVMRYGMDKLAQWALNGIFALAILFLGAAAVYSGQPPLWSLMTYLMMSFFCIGILFGNISALAMQPLGRFAGVGAAVVGSLSTLISTLLGTMIGQSYNGTVLPLAIGMALLTGISIFIVRWTTSSK
ncbi:MAG TPA: Bcr/CflA family drug resistance efflux transporter [Anaerolineae bacterium]|nr:Bcr/CflA family drug resistance efflux transporter [Anaerolineae bacterium]